MSDTPPTSPRARLQQLLAIPERQRTDEQWDEINELEIMLAAGNRPGAPDPRAQQQQQQRNAPGAGNARQRRGGESPHDRNNQQRKFHHKRPRRHPPGR